MTVVYAFVDPQDNVNRESSRVTPDVETKPGWRWLPLELNMPSYDGTQVLQGPTYIVNETSVSKTWTVRNKTQEELDSEKQNKIDSMDVNVLNLMLIQQNQIRSIQSLPLYTLEEYKETLKELL